MLAIHTPEVQFVLQAVRQASLLVHQVQAELVSPALTKDDRSPVTVADFASQALIGIDSVKINNFLTDGTPPKRH